MNYFFILPVLLIFSGNVLAGNKFNFSLMKASNYHNNLGCPTNSFCSKQLGLIYKKWDALFFKTKPNYRKLEQFKKKYGIPLGIWALNLPKNSGDIAFWDSTCNPKKNKPKIQWGEIFVKSIPHLMKKISTIQKKDKIIFHFDHIYGLFNKKVQSYIVPRRSTPTFVINNHLIFTMEKEGKYFQLRLDQLGFFKIIKDIDRDRETESVDCPQVLLDAFKKQVIPFEMKIETYCKKIWDQKNKKYRIMLFPWSCI